MGQPTGEMIASILVPFRPDGGPREAAWQWVYRWYRTHHPSWEIIVADSEGDWSKAQAVNRAARAARGQLLVIADADLFPHPNRLVEAVRLARTRPWIVPYTRVHRLSEAATQQIMEMDPSFSSLLDLDLVKPPYTGVPGAGLLVLSRKAFLQVGGMDEEFVGWGGEDAALGYALDTIVGPHTRLRADICHLWHPRQRRGLPYSANRTRARDYELAHGRHRAMRELLLERGSAPTLDSGGSSWVQRLRAWLFAKGRTVARRVRGRVRSIRNARVQ